MQPGERGRDPATGQKIAEVAELAEQKPRVQRNADEYRALINQADAQEDWTAMLRRAQAMEYLFGRGDPHVRWIDYPLRRRPVAGAAVRGARRAGQPHLGQWQLRLRRGQWRTGFQPGAGRASISCVSEGHGLQLTVPLV
jgi:hypothetical protein